MKSYLYAQDEHVWNIVENGWKTPTIPAKGEGSSVSIPKPRKDWTEVEVRDLQADFKAKNSIFTALSEREKLRISHCDTAKQAWDLLQTTYEGNKKVRAQKLQGLIYEFETMAMGDDETVDDFHGRILKITSQCRSLGAPFDEDKVVKKILRALPEKFHSKVTSIEDSFDIDEYPLDELIGNLKTYELRLKPEKKSKGVAFKAVKGKEEEDEPLDLALLTKEKHGNSNNKSLLSTWSDDEHQEVENVAFVSSLSLESESDEEFSDDETNKELKSTQEKFTKFEISSATASRLFNSGKAHHDTFGLGYSGENSKGTHFVRESNSEVEKGDPSTQVIKDTITRADKEPKSSQKVTHARMNQMFPTDHNRYATLKSFIPTCHYYGKLGHIRPRCNERLKSIPSGEEKLFVKSLHCELKEQKELINKLANLISKANMQNRDKPVWIRKDLNNQRSNHSDSTDSISDICLMTSVSTGNSSTYIEATCLVALTALADKRKDF
ncbi:uncharacterized protein LOC112191630 [Rosa chinensis]|uniref:uncharacterized protein LOC112191630 n=1 Tax=Rosa chinensis TaxID=74649 RepID=UPI000D0951C3|nr:uncharacterized protein LOC112191630 [Rosa chinensis]